MRTRSLLVASVLFLGAAEVRGLALIEEAKKDTAQHTGKGAR